MKEVLAIYKNLANRLIDYYHKDRKTISPKKVNYAKAIAKTAIVVVALAKEWNVACDNVISCAQWLKNTTKVRCPLAEWLLSLNADEIKIIMETPMTFTYNDLGVVYESLLSMDAHGMTLIEGKRNRNQFGSYYSPHTLVEYLTKKCISQYVSINGTKSLTLAKIADFSCGAGAFLVEALKVMTKCLCSHDNCKQKEILLLLANNVYACDVDCIALEVAKFSIIRMIGDFSCYPILSKHFVFGNFLLHTEDPCSFQQREQLYLDGIIYHPDLAIGVDFLSEYDIILGNPPWEKIRFEEKKFYSQYLDQLDTINFKNDTKQYIENQENVNNELYGFAKVYRDSLNECKATIKSMPYFRCSSVGELNTCTLFADASFNQLSAKGIAGLIIKSSTVTSPVNKRFFNKIMEKLVAVYDFINRNKYFDIDSRERFSFLIFEGEKRTTRFSFGMSLLSVDDIVNSCVEINERDLCLLNPDTHMLPNVSDTFRLKFLLSIYKQFRTIGALYPHLRYGRIVHYTTHAKFLEKQPTEDNIPIYEGKFFQIFDGSYAGYNHVPYSDRYKSKAQAQRLTSIDRQRGVEPLSRFYIGKNKWKALSHNYHADYMLAWHSLTSSTNGRACVSTILPFIPGSQSIQFLITDDIEELIYLACLFSSVTFDFIVKGKLNGIDLTQAIIKQIPIPSIELAKQTDIDGISVFEKMANLCYTLLKDDNRLDNLWEKIPFVAIEEYNDRKELFVQIDALAARLYSLSPDVLKHIASQYPSLYSDEFLNRLMAIY